MKRFPLNRTVQHFKTFSLALAVFFSSAFSQTLLLSADTGDQKRVTFTDVQLQKDGLLIGYVLDDQGNPVEKAKVTVSHNGRRIAAAVTNKRGAYLVKGLRGGVHVVHAKGTQSYFRFWADKTAPPSARKSALTISQSETIRAQWGVMYGTDPMSITATAIGIAAMVVAIEKQEDINDLRVEIDRIQANDLHDHPPVSP